MRFQNACFYCTSPVSPTKTPVRMTSLNIRSTLSSEQGNTGVTREAVLSTEVFKEDNYSAERRIEGDNHWMGEQFNLLQG